MDKEKRKRKEKPKREHLPLVESKTVLSLLFLLTFFAMIAADVLMAYSYIKTEAELRDTPLSFSMQFESEEALYEYLAALQGEGGSIQLISLQEDTQGSVIAQIESTALAVSTVDYQRFQDLIASANNSFGYEFISQSGQIDFDRDKVMAYIEANGVVDFFRMVTDVRNSMLTMFEHQAYAGLISSEVNQEMQGNLYILSVITGDIHPHLYFNNRSLTLSDINFPALEEYVTQTSSFIADLSRESRVWMVRMKDPITNLLMLISVQLAMDIALLSTYLYVRNAANSKKEETDQSEDESAKNELSDISIARLAYDVEPKPSEQPPQLLTVNSNQQQASSNPEIR